MFENEKVDLRVKYTREWTFNALNSLLETKEYQEIKVSEIIDIAGVSRATFYRNFNSKDDIVKIKVNTFFSQFHQSMILLYQKHHPEDETILVSEFFKKINEEEKVIDTVIKSNLEYLMVDGIIEMIQYYKNRFYKLIRTHKTTEDYIVEIVASSCWVLLRRWYLNGKKETPTQLARIFLSAYRSIYIALFEDRGNI